jgi:hypothetical protein
MNYNWARVGVFNAHNEAEQVAELDRIRRGQPIQDLGDHWMTWTMGDMDLCSWQRQHLVRDGRNRLERLYWTQDHIQFTRHAVERMYQRGSNLDGYIWNLGLENIQDYLTPLLKLQPLDGVITGRSDIVIPYKTGAVIGDLVHSDNTFGIEANRVGMFVSYQPIGLDKQKVITFRAQTYIDKQLIQPEQQNVIDLIDQGRMSVAAQAMEMIPVNEYREVILKRN